METKNESTRKIIQIDEGLGTESGNRNSKKYCKETLNSLLDAEADRLVQAEKF